jgi:hypothetical protein
MTVRLVHFSSRAASQPVILNAVKELRCSNSKLWPEFLIINGFMLNVLEHVMGSAAKQSKFDGTNCYAIASL